MEDQEKVDLAKANEIKVDETKVEAAGELEPEVKPEAKLELPKKSEENKETEPSKTVDPSTVDPKDLYAYLHDRAIWQEGEQKRINQAKEQREQARKDKDEAAKLKAEAQRLYAGVGDAQKLKILREHLVNDQELSEQDADAYLESKGLLKKIKPEDILALVPSMVEEELSKREQARKVDVDRQKITAAVTTLAVKNNIKPAVALALVKGVLTSGIKDPETGEWTELPLATTPEEALNLLLSYGFKGEGKPGEPAKPKEEKPLTGNTTERIDFARSFGS